MTALAFLTVLVSITASVVGLALIARTPLETIPVGYRLEEMLPFVVLQLAYAMVGALLAWRRPENPVGWLLCGAALASAALMLLSGQTVHALSTGAVGTAATAVWISGWLTVLGLGATQGLALLLFPDGRNPSRAARPAVAFLAITIGLLGVAIAFRPGPLTTFPGIVNPYAWHDHGGALDIAFALGLVGALFGTVLGIWSQVDRFRRSSGPERQQLKWFLVSAVFLSLALIPVFALMYGEWDPSVASDRRHAGRAVGALASTALPVAIGVAILRYRLYDIDVLINRTLVYGAVSAGLVVTYLGAVILFQTLLRPFTSGSELAVAGSTLLVVALFQPLRRRVQDAVDRRFYRSRYDAARTLDAFGARLRSDVDLDSIGADLIAVLHETVRPTHASLWLRERTS